MPRIAFLLTRSAAMFEAVTSDRCGDGPVKTILLCDKATLIPLCETCKAGPPTAALCKRDLCVLSVSDPPTVFACVQILCISTYV